MTNETQNLLPLRLEANKEVTERANGRVSAVDHANEASGIELSLSLSLSVRDKVTFYNAKYCYAYWYAKVKKFPLLFLVVRERLCIRWSFL